MVTLAVEVDSVLNARIVLEQGRRKLNSKTELIIDILDKNLPKMIIEGENNENE